MDFREARYKVLRSETMTNIWYTDTEGWLMPRGVPLWGSIDAANPIYWKWTADVAGTAACRLGSQWLGAMIDTTMVGTGVATAFGPITFPSVPLQVGFTSVWTVIGGAQYAWNDSDGIAETFTNIVHAIGNGAVGPYNFTSKAIALATSSVSINWTSGGTPYSVVDDGAGAFTDVKVSASSINYVTGVISVTFAGGFAPDNNTEISLSGTTATTFDVFFRQRMAIGDGSNTTFVISTENKRIRPGSFLFSYVILGTTYYAQDDGIGGIVDLYGVYVQAGSVVNYVTGAVTLILSSAPDQNTNIDVVYNKAGLVSSSVNYGTGQLSLTFAVGSEPDNGKTVFAMGSWRDHSDFAGVDVVTGIMVMNQASKRIHLRDARGYLDAGAEGYDGSVYPHYCKPFDIFSIAAYIRKHNGAETGFLRIRFWDGTSTYTQVTAGTVEWDSYSKFSGNFSIVDDPYNPGHNIYQFAVTETTKHDKLAMAFQVPVGARAFSVEFETDSVGTQEGDQIFSISGLYLSQGTTAMSYSPPAEITYLPRPTDGSGSIGRVLAYDIYGRTKWVDPQLLGVAAIATLNGLSASIQTFSIGAAGNSPSWSSAINNHSLNIPYASTAGVTGGLVAYANWANWQAMAGGTFSQAAAPNTFTRELVPSADNAIDLGTTVKRWRAIYGLTVYADTELQVGGATNRATFNVSGADFRIIRVGAVVNFNLTSFTTVTVSTLTATTAQANRLYALGASDNVHLEVVGNAVQTTNIFDIRNQGGSGYFRGNNSMVLSLLGNIAVTNNAIGTVALLAKAAVGQTANIFAVQNSGGSDLIWSTSTGVLGLANFAGALGTGLFNIPQASVAGLLTPVKAGYSIVNLPTWTAITGSTVINNARGFDWVCLGIGVLINGRVDVQITSSLSSFVIRLDTAIAGNAVDGYTTVYGTGIAYAVGGATPLSFPVQVTASAGRIFIEVIDPSSSAALDTGIYTVQFSAIAI